MRSVAAQSRDPRHTDRSERWAPALQRTVEEALRCVRGTRAEFGARSPHIVIASAAKQSRVVPQWDSGLLRCARNDGVTGDDIAHPVRISTCRHTFSSSRRNSPELCSITPPSYPGGRREGRVPAGTCGLLRECVAQEDRTAAYRWSPTHGLPCAMGWRLMPCSPGSRIPSGLPRPADDDAVRPVGLADTSAKGLTVATTARTTRFCRTRVRLMPQGSPALSTLREKCWRDELHSAVRPHAVSGSQGLPALPAPIVPTLPRPPQARLTTVTTYDRPSRSSRN